MNNSRRARTSSSGRISKQGSGTSDVSQIGVGTCCRAVLETVRGLARPRRPGRAEVAEVTQWGLPAASTTVRLQSLVQQPRQVPPFVVEGRAGGDPLLIGLRSYVVQHPRARILLEPATASQLRSRVLTQLPAVLRHAVRPPADTLSTVEALHAAGIDPTSLDWALPTHLHWDHVSGLLDLPELATMVHTPEWEWAMAGSTAPAAGVRPAMRDRPIESYQLDGPPVLTFPRSRDVFGDGSVVLVDLAGHTPGSVGVLLATECGPVLVAGDAAWHHSQVDAVAHKAGFPGLLVDEDRASTYQSLLRLHVASERVTVLPTHDHVLAGRWEADDLRSSR